MRHVRRAIWAGAMAAAFSGVGLSRAHASNPPAVEYVVSLPAPQTQMVSITMRVRRVEGPTLELSLPVWRPGRYVILDPASTLRELSAETPDGRILACEKTEKSTWLVSTEGRDEVVVSYRVYANSLNDRTRHVDDTHAFLSPSTVFLYAPSHRAEPLRVTIDAPKDWRIACGLDADPADPRTLLAPDYDTLVDSPIEAGAHDLLEFEVDGVPHQIVVWTAGGPPPPYDRAALPADFAKIVRAQKAIFGDLPYRRYVYIIHCVPGGSGGTEHLNSTVMQTSPESFSNPERRQRFMVLVSHEMFHTWNVKQLRPAGIKPYEYQHENYTDLLWVVEGTTSYYDDLCLVRAGLTKPDDFLATIASSIDAHRRRPGANVESVAEASFDAWIKFGRPNPDAINSAVSFYDKGSLVSFLLDMEVRLRSGGAASLDTAMASLYREFPLSGPGYTTADVLRTVERLSQSSFKVFFADYVSGVRQLDFDRALAVVGLESYLKPSEGDGSPASIAYLGINVEPKESHLHAASVLADGPAYTAGVIAGDLIVGINGERATSANWTRVLKHLKPGQAAELTLFRHDRQRTITVVAADRPDGAWKVRRVKSPTPEQQAAYESWLGQPWPEKAAASDSKDPAEARP
ncbi:MAG: M61 family metallopeptidase [Phycisphaerae bacterium]|nr:M61 family metallopeptidase [Phycisphaerae bacterium]